jgi:hypothetical protein
MSLLISFGLTYLTCLGPPNTSLELDDEMALFPFIGCGGDVSFVSSP